MNSRLQQFLTVEQLTPARLADTLGIQRSGISHILSGRNKPSYEFINNFISKFPKVDPTWLITGKGKMYKFESSDQTTPPINDGSLIFDIDDEFTENSPSNNSTNNTPEETVKNTNTSIDINRPIKKVRRITVYYSDASFEDFYPAK